MGYIASISLRLVGRLARNDGGQGHPAAHKEASFPLSLISLPHSLTRSPSVADGGSRGKKKGWLPIM